MHLTLCGLIYYLERIVHLDDVNRRRGRIGDTDFSTQERCYM
jgi:hypothetical protein